MRFWCIRKHVTNKQNMAWISFITCLQGKHKRKRKHLWLWLEIYGWTVLLVHFQLFIQFLNKLFKNSLWSRKFPKINARQSKIEQIWSFMCRVWSEFHLIFWTNFFKLLTALNFHPFSFLYHPIDSKNPVKFSISFVLKIWSLFYQ